MSNKNSKLGTAKICITPPSPVRLCGYATRETAYETVVEDIFLRVHVMEDENCILAFLYADILWWNSEFVLIAKKKLSKVFNISENNLIFVASHNHSGPPTGNSFIAQLETYDSNYADFLLLKCEEALNIAFSSMECVEIRRYDGLCNLNVYRRFCLDGEYVMRPNYDVPADKNLTLIGFYTKENTLKALQVHYACHANISNENVLQPDYPGVALRMLDDHFTGCTSLFFQGCTADLRPNCVIGEVFTPFGYEKVCEFAQSFFENCIRTLNATNIAIVPNFSINKVSADLQQDNVLTKNQAQTILTEEIAEPFSVAEAKQQWAKKIIEKQFKSYEVVELYKICYGKKLCMYTGNAEISQSYASYVRTLDENAIFTSYANGMIGYISTEEQIRQGGYEPIGSAMYFALSGTYSKDIEKIMCKSLKTL